MMPYDVLVPPDGVRQRLIRHREWVDKREYMIAAVPQILAGVLAGMGPAGADEVRVAVELAEESWKQLAPFRELPEEFSE
jgi:hypothetical protein